MSSPSLVPAQTKLHITGPSGFTVKTQDFTLPEFTGTLIRQTSVLRNGVMDETEYNFQAEVLADKRVIGSASATVQYVETLTLSRFLPIGILGIILGWFARLITKILTKLEPTVPLPDPTSGASTPQPIGPITSWIKNHYYPVDLFVTVLLGFMILLLMCKAGYIPPETMRHWHTALVGGFGIGLLTNSEMFTRIRS